jgi:hypothetical protein
MLWSKTPVVSLMLAITYAGLLPSGQLTTSAFFFPYKRDYPNDHNYTFFGAQYTACILDPSGFGLSSQSWPADFTTDLVANL